jgi:alkanesulfonate monooxygenase SsuD/methylene tetrahydromethanopterin reductase-like flavin-dependent oxidoreductase (luciferase family)
MHVDWTTHPWVQDGRGRIRLGIGVTANAPAVDWPTRLDTARAAEDLGVDSLWVPDHPARSMDCWTTLVGLAAVTRRMRLGSLVSCVLYRPPWSTARYAADVDRISGGRLVLGLGAGHTRTEFEYLGLPFPPPLERNRALKMTIEEVKRRWYGPPLELTGSGTTQRVHGDALRWPPVQQPRVPLLIGGSGEKVTLRRVAEYADMCNIETRLPHDDTAQDVRRKFQILCGYCESIGRPYESIIRSHVQNTVVLAPTDELAQRKQEALPAVYRERGNVTVRTPAELIEYYRPLVRAGVQYLIANLATHDDVETIELLARQVLPELQGLIVAGDYASA